METNAAPPPLLADAIPVFLASLRRGSVAVNTIRSYTHDLRLFAEQAPAELSAVTAEVVTAFLARFATPTTRRRRASTLAAFYHWLIQHEVVVNTPLDDSGVIPQVRGTPHPLPPETVRRILHTIPSTHLRNRLLLTVVSETGIAIGEALGLLVTEVSLAPEGARLRVVGRGRRERLVVLSATGDSVQLLRQYLQHSGITSGALFRGDPLHGGSALPLEYSVVHAAWQGYCRTAGVHATLRQLSQSAALVRTRRT